MNLNLQAGFAEDIKNEVNTFARLVDRAVSVAVEFAGTSRDTLSLLFTCLRSC